MIHITGIFADLIIAFSIIGLIGTIEDIIKLFVQDKYEDTTDIEVECEVMSNE